MIPKLDIEKGFVRDFGDANPLVRDVARVSFYAGALFAYRAVTEVAAEYGDSDEGVEMLKSIQDQLAAYCAEDSTE